ncbi:MAG: orotate phosphoribosyltransferase [Alphaproteobacteria bacterium]
MANSPPASPSLSSTDPFFAETARHAARILLETQSVMLRPEDPFILTSGRRSPVYTDCRRLIGFPRARARLMDLAIDLLERAAGIERFDVIAGGETAGIPFAAWIAERLALPMAYVRKKPKGFGRNAQIEGASLENRRVLLVEDLATDGGSKLNFIEALRTAGAEISHCFVIFHYGIFPAGVEDLRAQGVNLHALTTWWDVLTRAEEQKLFAPKSLSIIRDFLEKPEAWEP